MNTLIALLIYLLFANFCFSQTIYSSFLFEVNSTPTQITPPRGSTNLAPGFHSIPKVPISQWVPHCNG
uniref:Putative secreted protein n=1 Tax=Anopheles darlingi TaxID=43151 RepID=A0A2M4D181_ANODA